MAVSGVTRMGYGRHPEPGREDTRDRADENHMSGTSEGAPGFRIGAKWRIAAASLITGLLLCGAFGFTAHKHGEFVRANAQAHLDREDVLAAERAVSAFWQEREVMGELLAFPQRSLSDELRNRQLQFRGSLEAIRVERAAELADVERAKAANEKLIAVFNSQPAGRADVRRAAQLNNAERAVLKPVERLRASNRRDNLRGAAAADSAERVAFHSEIATAGFGLAAVALFGVFAVRQVRRIDNQNAELQATDVAKDEFIATVSHELRTPLTSINGYVELLLEEGAEPLTEGQRLE